MSHSCTTNSAIVGADKKHGSLYRCKICRQYWAIQSDRLWEDEVLDLDEELIEYEGIPQGYSPVFRGPGEMGLASSVLFGNTISEKILKEDFC
jgi:hypothetical protein